MHDSKVEICRLRLHTDARGAGTAAGVEEVAVPAGEAWRFVFPPGTGHAFKNTGTKPLVLMSFNTEEHDPAQPDAEHVELIS